MRSQVEKSLELIKKELAILRIAWSVFRGCFISARSIVSASDVLHFRRKWRGRRPWCPRAIIHARGRATIPVEMRKIASIRLRLQPIPASVCATSKIRGRCNQGCPTEARFAVWTVVVEHINYLRPRFCPRFSPFHDQYSDETSRSVAVLSEASRGIGAATAIHIASVAELLRRRHGARRAFFDARRRDVLARVQPAFVQGRAEADVQIEA